MIDKNQLGIVEELEALFSRFLALSLGLALVLALWSVATHLYELFDAFPYLAITSPTKRCGKTRVWELLGLVCFRPPADREHHGRYAVPTAQGTKANLAH